MGPIRRYAVAVLPVLALYGALGIQPSQAAAAPAGGPATGLERRVAVRYQAERIQAAELELAGRDMQGKIAATRQYEKLIRAIAREEGIPYELLYSAVVMESGGNPRAHSEAGARGLLQLLPGTAREQGLMVSRSRDERLDPEKNLRAGARYAREQYNRFGTWPLAWAAYHWGPKNLEQRLLHHTQSRDFWELASHPATRNHIPPRTRAHVASMYAVAQSLQQHTQAAQAMPQPAPQPTPVPVQASVQQPTFTYVGSVISDRGSRAGLPGFREYYRFRTQPGQQRSEAVRAFLSQPMHQAGKHVLELAEAGIGLHTLQFPGGVIEIRVPKQ